jgi:hypothetical protein
MLFYSANFGWDDNARASSGGLENLEDLALNWANAEIWREVHWNHRGSSRKHCHTINIVMRRSIGVTFGTVVLANRQLRLFACEDAR